MSRIGVGVVGIGIAALSSHIPIVAQSSEFELTALMDREPAKLDDAQKLWPKCPSFTKLDEFLAVAGLDAVNVATPPDSHQVVAGQAIGRGKHVLVEKPLAASLRECRALVELAARHGVSLLVGHEKRFHPSFEKIRSILRAGEVGKPYYCGVHWSSNAKMDPANLVAEGFRDGYVPPGPVRPLPFPITNRRFARNDNNGCSWRYPKQIEKGFRKDVGNCALSLNNPSLRSIRMLPGCPASCD